MRNNYFLLFFCSFLLKFTTLFSNYTITSGSKLPILTKNRHSSKYSFIKKPVPQKNNQKPLDCGIPAPNIVNYGCLDMVWQKDYKLSNNNNLQVNETPIKIYPTSDGGYIFASNSQISPNNSGDSEYAVFKVDANGNRLWSKTFGTINKDFLTAFVPTNDGGYILGGYSEGGINRDKTSASKGSNDIWLIKINANGTKIWDKSFGGSDQDILTSMISTADGGFLLGASSSSGINGDKTEAYWGGYYDSWVLKIDTNGNKVWDKTFGGTGYESTRAVCETIDGYIIGTQSNSGIDGNKTSTSKGNNDFWIIKVDFAGTKIWENSYGGSNSDIPQTINKTTDGSFIIGGFSKSSISGDKTQKNRGLDDVWVLKINSSGTKIWDKTIGGSNNEYVTSATTTPTGNIIFNVDSYSNISGDKKHNIISPNSTDQWLFEMTPTGVQLWEKYLNGINGFFPNSGDLIIRDNHLISLGNADYSITRQYDFWNIGLKKISYCNSQPITSTTICKGKCATLVAENCISGIVKWSNGEYGTSICASPNNTQNYKSVCLSADSTCVGDSSAVFTVNVISSDAVSISPSGFSNITSCGTSQTITATGCTNGTLSWSNGLTGNPITFVPTNNQIVKAICTMSNGCISESAYLSISVNNIASPYLFGKPSQAICAGQTLNLTTNCNGGTANWTGGLTGESIIINPTSTFTMRVACSYSNGCVSDSSHSYPNDTIKVIARPTTPTITNYSCLTKAWDKTFGGGSTEYSPKILKVNGGYILAGTSSSYADEDKTDNKRGTGLNTLETDFWIVKVNNNGDKIWDKVYGGSGNEDLSNIIALADGNIMLIGTSESGIGYEKTEASRGEKDFWVVKIDQNGNKIWDKTFGGVGSEQSPIIQEITNGFILGGTSVSGIGGDKTANYISNGVSHFWVIKLDQQGTKIWDKTYGGTGLLNYGSYLGENLSAISVIGSNYYLFGSASSPANNSIGTKTSLNKGIKDYWLLKIDSDGNRVWDKTYGGSSTSYNYSGTLLYTNDGYITMTGSSTSTKAGDKSRSAVALNGYFNPWIIRIDTSGNKLWDKTYGGPATFVEPCGKIVQDNQQGYFLYVNSSSNKGFDKSEDAKKDNYGSNSFDYWLISLDSNGDKRWDRTIGGNLYDYASDILFDNGSLLVLGVSSSNKSGDKTQNAKGDGSEDYWLVKMNECQPNITNSVLICKNDSTFLTTKGCPNASTVRWSNNETSQTISVKPTVTTTYRAICVSTDPGTCQGDSSSAFTVNVNIILPPTITPSNTSICQSGGSVTLIGSGCNGTYGWTGGASTSSIIVSPISAKTYKLACTSSGCTSDSASITINVTIPNKPALSISNQNICFGANATITATGCIGGTYTWTGGLTGSSITVSPIYTKSFKAVCKIGSCISDSSITSTVNVNILPTIARYNCLNKVWDKRFGGNQNDQLRKVIKLSDGYLLAGSSGSFISGDKTQTNVAQNATMSDYWIVKVDANGNKIWDKTYGGTDIDRLTDVIKLTDGNMILAGYSYSPLSGDKSEASRGGSDYWIVKIDANGNKIWDKTYGGSLDETFANSQVSIRETPDGLLLGGTSYSGISGDKTQPLTFPGFDFWILKLNLQGDKIWDKVYGGDSWDVFSSMEILSSNEYLLLGSSLSSANNTQGTKTSINKGSDDYWLLKIDANGNKVWDKTYGGAGSDRYASMVVSTDGKITMAGISQSDAGTGSDKSRNHLGSYAYYYDLWVIQVDANGNKIWDKTYGTASNEQNIIDNFGPQITYTPQGSFIVATQTNATTKEYDLSQNSKNNSSDYWILELNDKGEKKWDKSFGGNDADYVVNVIAENNNLIIGGTSFSGIGGDKTQESRGVLDYWLVNMSYCSPDIVSATTICKNDSVLFAVHGCANGSALKWNNNETLQTIYAKPLLTTNYKVLCNNGICNQDSSTAYRVNVIQITSPNIIASNNTICQQGGSSVLTASGCSGTYGWTGGINTNSITITPIATKTYKVACTFNGCTSDSTSITITVGQPNKPTLSPLSQSICLGSSTTITASGCNGGTYTWTGGLTGSSIVVSPTINKSFKAICTIDNCTSDSSLISTITINPIPSIPAINSPSSSTLCSGNSIILSVNNPVSSGIYKWTGGLSGSSITVSPTNTKSYRVNLSLNNCSSDSSTSVMINVQSKPVVTLTPSVTTPICPGQSITIVASGCIGGTYAWTNGLTGTSITVAPIINKTYKAACTINSCISDSTSFAVTVGQSSQQPITTASSICQGNNLTIGNGLKSTIPNCSTGSNSTTATYSGGTIGYDGSNSSGNNPTVSISGMSSTISKVVVSTTWIKKGGGNQYSCGTTHNGGNPYLGEVSFKIQAPDGTQITLVPSGTYSGNYVGQITTTFDDASTMTLSSTPTTSSVRPSSSLTGFNGKSPNGVWTLLPYDNGGGDPLCVSGFSISITTSGSTSTITWWDTQIGGNQVATGSELLPITNNLLAGTYTYYAQANCSGLCPSTRVPTILNIKAKPSTPTIYTDNNQTSATILMGDSLRLTATGCNGTINWSNGLTGNSIIVKPVVNTSYSATCTDNSCISDNSTLFSVVVSTGIYETLKSGTWNDPTIWASNRVPTSSNDVFINSGHTITTPSGNIFAKTITYRGGILQLQNLTILKLGN